MKKWTSLLIALFFVGCSSLPFQEEQAQASTCQSPYALIKQPTITAQKNDLEIKDEEVSAILSSLMQDKCLEFSDGADAYEFEVSYSSEATSQKQENIASVAQENTATIKVVFSLKKDRTTRQFNSEQSITINGKKVLGIGQSAKISDKEKEKLLKSAITKAYLQAINSLRGRAGNF